MMSNISVILEGLNESAKDNAKNKLHNYIEACDVEIKSGKSVYQAIKAVGKKFDFDLEGKTAEFLFDHYTKR